MRDAPARTYIDFRANRPIDALRSSFAWECPACDVTIVVYCDWVGWAEQLEVEVELHEWGVHHIRAVRGDTPDSPGLTLPVTDRDVSSQSSAVPAALMPPPTTPRRAHPSWG